MSTNLRRAIVAALAASVAVWLAPGTLRASRPGTRTAREAIASAVAERLGPGAEIVIHAVEPAAESARYRDAVPDPAAKLGQSMWFTLASDEPGLPRATQVLADVRVMVECVRALHDIERGHVIAPADIAAIRDDASGAPLHRLPVLAQVLGARALRPIAARSLVLAGFVSGKRAVDAGDTVTVIAIAGAVEVSAQLVAADAGDPGDVIRVVNKETRRYLRARVISAGVVEVVHGG